MTGGERGQTLLVYSAEPSSPSAQALDLLASWAAPNVTAESEEQAWKS